MQAQAMYVICRQLRPPRSYQTRIENRNRDRHRPPSSFRRIIADILTNAMPFSNVGNRIFFENEITEICSHLVYLEFL